MIEAFQTMTTDDFIMVMKFLLACTIVTFGFWVYDEYKKEEL